MSILPCQGTRPTANQSTTSIISHIRTQESSDSSSGEEDSSDDQKTVQIQQYIITYWGCWGWDK